MAGPDQGRPDAADKPAGASTDAGGGGDDDVTSAEREPAARQVRYPRNRRVITGSCEIVYLHPGQRIEEGW